MTKKVLKKNYQNFFKELFDTLKLKKKYNENSICELC